METINLFVQPGILQQIGHARLAKFLYGFEADLRQSSSLSSDLSSVASAKEEALLATDGWPGSLVAFFASTETLPPRLLQALSILETAAAPENADRLNALIQRHIPNVSLNRSCPLDCALELWFTSPNLLSEAGFTSPEILLSSSSPVLHSFNEGGSLATPESDEGGSPARSEVPIPNRDSSTVQGSTVQPSAVQSSALQGSALQGSAVQGSAVQGSGPSTFNFQPSTAPTNFGNLNVQDIQPWPAPVSGAALLDELVAALSRFVILPAHAAIALALWIVHTYAFKLRDVTTYIGIESPEKQCGKTTLLAVLNELVNRAVAASNVSPPAFFRVIEDLAPTLLIDEGDTFLKGNDQLRGILNAGYKQKTAFVLRAGPAVSSAHPLPIRWGEGRGEGDRDIRTKAPIEDEESATPEAIGQVTRFSCWCPKVIATIGHLPDTLADRCIVIRMQRKTPHEKCDRLRDLVPLPLKQKCARFVLDHQNQIADAQPVSPPELSDRAAEIWEPLLAIADLAGDKWPELARKAALALAASAQQSSPIASLMLDMYVIFTETRQDRLFSRELVEHMNVRFSERPWMEMDKTFPLTDRCLSNHLRPYGIRPKMLRIGDRQARGYRKEDCLETFRRYISRADLDALSADYPPISP